MESIRTARGSRHRLVAYLGELNLPTRPRDGRPHKTVHLRCVTQPGEAQKVLLNRLGLTLPQRLRRLD